MLQQDEIEQSHVIHFSWIQRGLEPKPAPEGLEAEKLGVL